MSTWHVWGDFVHTKPERIGDAYLVSDDRGRPRQTAEANGFDFMRRLHNGFEPWAAEFAAESDRGLEFALASYPTVRGWKLVSP